MGADADPDHTVDFYIIVSLFFGTPLGLLGALVLMLLMILVASIRGLASHDDAATEVIEVKALPEAA